MGQASGSEAVSPVCDAVMRADRDLPAGTVLSGRTSHHRIDGVSAELHDYRPLAPDAPLPDFIAMDRPTRLRSRCCGACGGNKTKLGRREYEQAGRLSISSILDTAPIRTRIGTAWAEGYTAAKIWGLRRSQNGEGHCEYCRGQNQSIVNGSVEGKHP